MGVHPRSEVSRQGVEQLAHVLSDLRIGGEERYVPVLLGGGGVVVPRAHVGVADQPVAFETDDLEQLGVDLEIHRPVHDVYADLLHLPRPEDVVALVELGAQLHQNGYGLAVLLGAHQRLDQGRVLPDPVKADLDALHVRILGGFVDETDDGRERFVRVVQDPIAVPYGLEHVHALRELGRHVRLEGLLLQLRAVEPDQLPQVPQSDDVRSVDLQIGDLEVPGEQPHHIRGHGPLYGHPHGESDVPVLQGLLDGGHEIAGLVDRHLDVGVPGDPEGVRSHDIQSGEEGGDVLLEDILQHDVLLALGRGHADESRKGADGDLDPGVELVVVLVVHPHGDIQGVVGDEGERMADIQRERREQGVDPLLVESRDPGLLIGRQLVHFVYMDVRCGELADQTVPAFRIIGDQPLDDAGDLLHQSAVVDIGVVRPGDGRLGDYPRDADHVELVQIAVADGEELRPLQERVGRILRLLETAPVELKPGELPVDVVLGVVQVGGLGPLVAARPAATADGHLTPPPTSSP